MKIVSYYYGLKLRLGRLKEKPWKSQKRQEIMQI